MDDQRFLIPKRLDDPPRFLLWDFDVAIIAMGAMVFGMAAGFMLTGMTVGCLLAMGYQKVKAGKHRAFGMHAIYWFLPVNFGMRRTPPSCIREFIG